jgi:hypothetical protein
MSDNLQKKILLIIFLAFVILFFSTIIFLYIQKNIHLYSFSQNIISYKIGFVPNGFLGSIIIKLKEVLNIEPAILLSFVYLLLHITNTGLFLILINNFARANFFITLFLIFNPALIMFPLYDIGALFRKEAFVIFLLLFHFLISNLFLRKKISKFIYIKILVLVIIPGIILNCLIYNVQFFLIPVHILVIKNNLNITRRNLFALLTFFILFFFLIDYLKINIDHEYLYKLTQEIIGNDQKISAAPFIWLENNLYTSILLTIYEINNWENFHKVYLIRNYTLALIILLVPLIFIFSQLNFQNKSIHRNKILISLTPCLCLFFLGVDWGRWIHIIFMTVIMYFSQFKFKKIIIPKNYYFVFTSIILVYVTSFGIPHCCAKNIALHGFWKNINFILNSF